MDSTGNGKTEFLENYYKPASDVLEELRLINEESEIPLILRETEDVLSLLLELTHPTSILEIGTGYGYSSLFFASKCPGAHITTIEKSDEMASEASKYISLHDKEGRIKLIEGDALDVLPSLRGQEFDFVFIDASKTHYGEFFDLAEGLCKPGALIVCDNILMHGWIYDPDKEGAYRHRTSVKYMKNFLSKLKDRPDLTVSYSSGGDGLAIIKLSE